MTSWSHLSNAKHIDWVIASLKVHPGKWAAARLSIRDAAVPAAYNAARVAARYNAWYVVYHAACNAARGKAWEAARIAAFDAAWDAAYEAAADAIIALIAYDDCAYMIESEIGELKIIAAFGDQRALLLLPACIVFNETKVLA